MPDAYNPWGAPVFPTADDNAMQPETFVPQGVQDWTRQAAPKDYNILSQIAGSLGNALMYPGQVAQSQVPISTEDMVAPAFNLASMLTLGAGAAPQEANALNMGIKAYHGSPHDFDKFDLSKIGTGEGAQAYGHGLYFADNEGVAKSYRDNLGRNRALSDAAFNPDGTPNRVGMVAQHLDAGIPEDRILEGLKVLEPAASPTQLQDILAQGRSKFAEADKAGRMYEVNINADPSHFLDWDNPLSQQPSIVQDMARNADLSHLAPGNRTRRQIEMWREGNLPNPESEPSGNVLHSALTDYGMNSQNNAAFREAGIPGIKYLDQGSRGAPEFKVNFGPGEGYSKYKLRSDAEAALNDAISQGKKANLEEIGSRNYVVFNHDLIDIMRKYAVPGMLGAPILANALSEQKT